MDVAILGTGLMGTPMAERLRAAGHSVVAYNRTRAKAEALKKAGVSLAEQPEEAVRRAACVLTVLADAKATGDVLLSKNTRETLAGRTVVQMATIGPTESVRFKQEVENAGGEYLEAPVLGSIAEVRAGRLIIMVGAAPEQFEKWRGLLRCLGEHPCLIGPVGKAATVKLALNQMIAAEIAAFSLSLGLVQREQVPIETFMEILRQSALYAPAYDKKLPRLLTRDYANPNFSTRHMLKDVQLLIHEASRLGLDSRSLEGVRLLLDRAIEGGLGDGDYSAVFDAVNPTS